MSIHPACAAQITLLIAEKVTILAKYLNLLDVFSENQLQKLSKYSDITKYLIDLESNN